MLSNCKKSLQHGIDELGLEVPASTQHAMLDFLEFLIQWNRAYNLTAIKEPDRMVTHHLLDSLSILPDLKGARILDVGSGAGFPGIPLAFACPNKQFVLLDSRGKKTSFLLQAAASFKLHHVTVVHSRMENYRNDHFFDNITSRAMGTMNEIINATQHLITRGGQWLMMKGSYPREELDTIDYPYIIHPLQVPGLKAKRHVVIISYEKDLKED